MKAKLLLLTIAMCFMVFSVHAQLVQYNFSSGTETVNSGSQPNAILTFSGAGATFAAANNSNTATAMGEALTLDGTANATTTGAPAWTGVNGTTATTVMAWVKIDPNTYVSGMVICSWGTLSGTNGFLLTVQDFSGVPTLRFQAGGTAVRAHVKNTQMSTLADNAWHHIAMTLDGTGNASGIKFYLDGTLISGAYGGATGTGMNVTDTADSFLIGSKPSLANPFHGSIDDFRVYGSALDEATISGIANIAIAPPVADFSADTTTPTVGDIVTFTDASTGNPTSWTWDFGDATVVGDETAQNPQVSFQTPGTYSVTLTASNAGGDSAPLVKTDYITVSAGTGSGDLQAQYNFDGDLTDASSYGRDLSPVGAFSPTYEADADTNASSALTTSGVYADHLITGYPGIGSGNARTVTAWFKTTGTARESIVSWGKDASGQMFNVMIHDGVPRIEGGSSSLLTSDTGLNDDNWHHIAVTYDPADGDKLANCKIYIDGNLSSNLADGASLSYQSATTVINTNITTNFLKIGSAVYNTYTFHGAVDDVRIYSKALTPSEIAQVMNRQTLSTIKNEMTQTIKVFPTQVSSYLNVKTKTSEGLSVSVYNILGRMVKATSIDQNETSIDMSTLSAGLYIVKVKSGEQVSTVKVIKE